MVDESQAVPFEEILDDCEAVLQYQFRDRELLKRCLTHSSIAKTRLESNERLEFLGDAILGMIVCEMLYHRFPDHPEGELTRIKSILVSRNTCAKISERLGFERFVFLGKGLAIHETLPMSILAALYEALVAGIYFDGGFQAAREFVEWTILPEVEATVDLNQGKNYKSLLQQTSQKMFGKTPIYKLLDEKGPDHSKCFKIAAVIEPNTYPPAWGSSKKEAEQRAAHNALYQLQGKEVPYIAD